MGRLNGKYSTKGSRNSNRTALAMTGVSGKGIAKVRAAKCSWTHQYLFRRLPNYHVMLEEHLHLYEIRANSATFWSS